MASLAREVALGVTASFRHAADFTADSGSRRVSGRPGPDGTDSLRIPSRNPGGGTDNGADHLPPIMDETARRSMQQRQQAWQPQAGETVVRVAAGDGDDYESPSDEARQAASQAFARRVRFGINASWVINIVLFLAKVVAFALSMSMAVLASAIDSFVDILSQGLLAIAEYQAAHYNPRYPIGRTRMAELSVIGCAIIMFISTTLVIREASGALNDGIHGHLPGLEATPAMFAILGAATVLKMGLWLYCRLLRKNPLMLALSQDHLNDVMSNAGAIAGAGIGFYVKGAWFVDPLMALFFSAIIIFNWLRIIKEQAENIAGLEAPAQLKCEIMQLVETHHSLMQLDHVIAYHHGARYIAEVEITLPPDMTVRESHDIALKLQHKIEALEDVERAYVHVDWQARVYAEHKVEFNLKNGIKDVMQGLTHPDALAIVAAGSGSQQQQPLPNEVLPVTAAAAAYGSPTSVQAAPRSSAAASRNSSRPNSGGAE